MAFPLVPPANFECVTPPSTPRKDSFSTPLRLKTAQKLIQEQELAKYSPAGKGFKQAVEDGLGVLRDVATPKPFKRKKGSELIDEVYHQLEPTGLDRLTPEFHEVTAKAIEEDGLSNTGMKIIAVASQAMQQSPLRVVHLRHLTTLDDKVGGYHLHLPNSPVPIEVLAVNPLTRIRFALVGGKKKSSLFPEGTDKQQVIEMANSPCSIKIAEEGNRILRLTRYGYVIEAYIRDQISIRSAFPIFFYAEFGSEEKYNLTEDCSVFSDEVLNAAFDSRAKINYRIKLDDHIESLIIDIAPVFEERTKVSKGILIKFDRAAVPELEQIFINEEEKQSI